MSAMSAMYSGSRSVVASRHGERAVLRSEGDPDVFALEVFGQLGLSAADREQRGQPLLAIDDEQRRRLFLVRSPITLVGTPSAPVSQNSK